MLNDIQEGKTHEQQADVLQGRLKQTLGTKTRLECQMDTLDIGDPHYLRILMYPRYKEGTNRTKTLLLQKQSGKL